jgi:hypothetical protein
MLKRSTIRVVAAMNSSREKSASVAFEELSTSQRVLNALKILGLMWGGGIICVFVPVLHFFLVPAALILGMVFSIRQFSFRSALSSGDVICPECGANISLNLAPFNWPKRQQCQSCQARILMLLA